MFTVSAAGAGPLQYLWRKNGAAIPGASGASLITPTAAPADNGANFAVTVTNAVGTVTSNTASLTVGPRAPKAGDWRFQALDLPAFIPFLNTGLLSREEAWYINAIGTPLTIGIDPGPGLCAPAGTESCGWGYLVDSQPAGSSGLTPYYWSDFFTSFDADMQTVIAPNTVITTLDLHPANNLFAVSWLQTSATDGFTILTQSVEPQEVQAVVSQLGAESQVVTALSFNAGQVQLMSYGWQSDTTTIYEAKAVAATGATFIADATNLAAAGYIITALGGDPTDGLVLVGTRVQGDTMPRPILFATSAGTQGQLDTTVEPIRRDVFNSNGDNWINQQ